MEKENQLHPFDQATNLSFKDAIYKGKTSKDYGNIIGLFGGTSAAVVLKAIMDHPERIGEPISLTVNFAAPIKEGDFTVEARPTKTSRTTQHWYVELKQEAGVSITGTAVLAKRRKTFSASELQAPDVAKPELLPSVPGEGLPAWVGRYDMKIVEGIPNLAEPGLVEDSETIQWIKDRPARALDFLSLTSICDAFFPRIFLKRNEMTLVGTVSLTVYFHARGETIEAVGEDYVLARAWANKFYDRFFDQLGEIYSASGDLLATTSQMVYFRK